MFANDVHTYFRIFYVCLQPYITHMQLNDLSRMVAASIHDVVSCVDVEKVFFFLSLSPVLRAYERA